MMVKYNKGFPVNSRKHTLYVQCLVLLYTACTFQNLFSDWDNLYKNLPSQALTYRYWKIALLRRVRGNTAPWVGILKGSIYNKNIYKGRWALMRQDQGHLNGLLRPLPSPAHTGFAESHQPIFTYFEGGMFNCRESEIITTLPAFYLPY